MNFSKVKYTNSMVFDNFSKKLKYSIIAAGTLVASLAIAAPTGGQVSVGAGTITQQGVTTTITQNSQRLAINWQDFNIGNTETVRFDQPDSNSVALNRVIGQSPSQILGKLVANGQIFILNPNGILFGNGAEVNVGGLLASTSSMSDKDLSSGNYHLTTNSSAASIINRSTINTINGGYVALVARHVSNEGYINTQNGTALLAAGNDVSLMLDNGSLVSYTINQGTIDALVENKQAIIADGGMVILTANAQNTLTTAVVNNTGMIRARTIANISGTIKLLGGEVNGTVNVSGILDASAPSVGNGGVIETSATQVNVNNATKITTLANNGSNGTWLIDPVDFTIAAAGGDMTGTLLTTSLASGNVTILSSNGLIGTAGNININDMITWSANTLTLNAQNNILANANLNASGTGALALQYGQGALASGNTSNFYLNNGVQINLPTGSYFSTKLGSNGVTKNYVVINNLGAQGSSTGLDLQGISGNLSGNYVLGSNIDATVTSTWNSSAGFTPIGTGQFTGTFNGLGHTINNLTINLPSINTVGLFGNISASATIRDIGLVAGTISGNSYVGALVGINTGGTLVNSYSTLAVNGGFYTGGLVGQNIGGSISNSYATGDVTTTTTTGGTGGLVGWSNGGTITNCHASGTINAIGGYEGGLVGKIDNGIVKDSYSSSNVTGASNNVGGLVGGTNNGSITGSYASGNISGVNYIGGLVGYTSNYGTITSSYSTGIVNSSGSYVGGLVGATSGTTINSSYSSSSVTGTGSIGDEGGLIGWNNGGQVSNSYATGNVNGTNNVGGLVGHNSNFSSSYIGTITNSYSVGSVNGTLNNIGGLVGINNGGTINMAYATGSVSGTTNVGGLVGNNASGTIYNSFWDNVSAGQSTSAGGTGMTTAQMMGVANFTGATAANGNINPGWDFNGIWVMYDTYTYPMLRSFMTPLTITASNAAKTYNGLAYTGGAGVNYSVIPNGSLVGSVIYSGTSQGAVNAGSYTIIPSGFHSTQQQGGYAITYVNGMLTVSPAPLSITAANAAKTYDGNIYVGNNGITYSGFVNGETTGVLGGSLVTGGNSQGAANAGTYSIAMSGVTSQNYAINYVNGTLTINQAPLTVIGTTVANKVYNGNVTATLTGGTLSGLIGNDALTLTQSGTFATANAGNGIVVSANDSISGLLVNNYLLAQPTGLSANITQAPLTITAMPQSTYYIGTGYTGGAGITYSGFVAGQGLSVLGGTLAYTGSSQGAINAGNYVITPGGLTSSNYAINFVNGILSILKTPLNITANNTQKNYDGLAYTGGNGVVYNGFVNGETPSILGGTISYTGNSQGAINAGNYTIVPGGQTSSNYTLNYIAGALNITQANLTVTANNAAKTYNGLGYTGGNGVTYSGLVNGETSAVLAGALVYGGNSQSAINTGSYTIIPSGLTSGNYFITYANGTLTVNPSVLTITANNAAKTYNGMAYTGGNGVTYAGFVNGQTSSVLTGTITYSGTSQGVINTGNYSIIPSGQTSTNYAINYVNGTLTINQAALSVTANNFSKNYNGIPYSGGNGISYSGFVNGETASVIGGTLVYGNSSQGATNAGGYIITPSGLTSGNYAISYINGTLTINQVGLNVTANNASKIYNGLTYSGGNGVTYTGFVNSETASVLGGVLGYTGSSQSAINAGSYVITPSGLVSNNYLISYVSGALTVNQAALSVTANPASKPYDGLVYNGGNGVTYSGFANNETASVLGGTLVYGGNSQGAINTGNYTISPSGLTSGNYTIGYVNGVLTINPAALTVTANNASKIYNGLAYSGGNSVTYAGFMNGQTSSVLGGTITYTGTSQGAINTGNYVITPGGLTSSNYTISYANGTLAVTAAPLTITANNASKAYNGIAYTGGNGVTYNGFVNGETASALGGTLAYSGTSQGAINVGGYGINPGGLTSSNYTIGYVNGTLTVNPAGLTITANNAVKTYNGLAYTGGNGVTYNGFVNGETASALGGTLAYGGNSQGAINTGSYTITPSGLTSSNYTLLFVNGALTVGAAPLTITANNSIKLYNGLSYSGGNGVVYSGFVNSETASVLGGTLVYGGNSQGAINAGSYAISPSGLTSNNYAVSYVNGVLAVNPVSLVASVTGTPSKVYDGTTNAILSAASYTLSGFVSGQGATITQTVGNYNNANVSAANSVTTSLAPANFTANANTLLSNYILPTAATGPANITMSPLTITANAATKPYDGNAYAGGNGVAYAGLVNGETPVVLSGTLAYGGNSQGAVTTGSYSIAPSGLTSTNYAISYVNGVLSIVPAALTITANNLSMVYNGVAYVGGNGVTYTGFVNNDTASVLGGTLVYGGTSQGATNTGNFAIIPSGLTSSKYILTFVPGTLTITPAALNIIANNASRAYNGQAYTGGNGVVYTGFVSGQTPVVLGGTLLYSGTSQGATNAGTYNITPSGLTSANYTINFVNGTLTINPDVLTITANAASKTYNGLVYSGGTGVSYAGFVNNETFAVLGGTLTYNGTSQGAINAGNYVITPGGLTSNNYTISFINGMLTVNPATLTVTANNASRAYNGQTYNGGNGVTYAGLVNNETPAVLSGTLIYTGSSQGAINASNYIITPGGLNGGNYTIGYINGTLSITPVALTVTANNASKTYNALAYSGGNGVTYTGFVNGETSSVMGGALIYTGTSQGATNTGNYVVTPSGLTSSNYTVSFMNGNLAVVPATLTVTGTTVANKVYDGTNVANLTGGTLNGIFGNDVVNLTQSGSFATQNAGNNIAVTAVDTISGTSMNNYVLTQPSNLKANITPAALTITANNAMKTYDGLEYLGGNGVIYAGMVNNETTSVLAGTLAYNGTAQHGINAGIYNIVPNGLSSGNYSITYVNGILTVNKANLTVTGTNVANKAYDGKTTATLSGGILTGMVGNDTLTLVQAGNFAGTNAGNNVGVIAIDSITGTSAVNYTLTQPTGLVANISKVALTIIADNQMKSFGQTDPSLTYQVIGLVNNETPGSVLTGSLARVSGFSSGIYAINQGTLASNTNYSVTYNAGAMRILPFVESGNAINTHAAPQESGYEMVSLRAPVNHINNQYEPYHQSVNEEDKWWQAHISADKEIEAITIIDGGLFLPDDMRMKAISYQ